MGLGGISSNDGLPETSLDFMTEKLLKLKEPFLQSFNPSAKSRKDRINRVIQLIEENSDALHTAISKDFGSRHEQMSQLTDTLATVSHAKHVLKKIWDVEQNYGSVILGFIKKKSINLYSKK